MKAQKVIADVRIRFWNPVTSKSFWLPRDFTPSAYPQGYQEYIEAQHNMQKDEDAARSRYTGRATWQIWLDFDSHHDTVQYGRRLKAEGYAPVTGWKHLVVGAQHEDDARAVAKIFEGQAPPGTKIFVSRASVYHV
jgi:hypothetical protein